jgi:hypothetical protein
MRHLPIFLRIGRSGYSGVPEDIFKGALSRDFLSPNLPGTNKSRNSIFIALCYSCFLHEFIKFIYHNIFIVFGFFADTFHHKVHTYIEYHSVCPLVGIGTLPPPLSPASVPLPPEPKGGGHNRLQVRGWGSPNSDDWRKSLALCLLCAFHNILTTIFSAIKSFMDVCVVYRII